MSLMEVRNISTFYGTKQVLDNISFEINAGEMLGILGENGCGKSTLINSICNILPHKGSSFLGEEQMEKMSPRQLARQCSYVPQKSGLEIEMSVLDTILMGFNPKLKLFESPTKDMVDCVRNELENIGFQDKLELDFMTLSEGQKQMCILMRALITDCKVILMDEPENALDVRMRSQMMRLVRQWIEKHQGSAIMALHDTELALNYCDRLLLIKDGKIVGNIQIGQDSLKDMEASLSKVYGKVCLRQVEDGVGKSHLVMLKEDE